MVSEDPALVAALRRTYIDLEREVESAENGAAVAQRRLRASRERQQEFVAQLPAVCAAANIAVSAVTNPRDASELGPTHANEAEQALSFESTSYLALPSRPQSLRWYAGQMLYRYGTEMPIAELADAMRRAGFKHSHGPSNPQQLEQSLAALPNQIDWVVRGEMPGTLALDLDKLQRQRPRP